jgi:hypothetical protein
MQRAASAARFILSAGYIGRVRIVDAPAGHAERNEVSR